MGSTARDIAKFPRDAQSKLGTGLRAAQEGGRHSSAKPMKGTLREVIEIVSRSSDGTYRLMYAAQLEEEIYVLHTFKKKAHEESETPKHELDLIAQRLRTAKAIARGG